MVATHHFQKRVRERIGGDADPLYIAEAIGWAIEHARSDLVEFLHRQDKHGLRLFRFRYPDGRFFRVLANTKAGVLVTLYPDEEDRAAA